MLPNFELRVLRKYKNVLLAGGEYTIDGRPMYTSIPIDTLQYRTRERHENLDQTYWSGWPDVPIVENDNG